MAAPLNDKFGDLIDDFKKDGTKEIGGVWMTYKKHKFLVARAHRNNTAFAKLIEERMRPYQWAIERGNLAALRDVAQTVLQEVYAETVLKGIAKIDGTPLDYLPADGVQLFKQLPDLWDIVYKFADSESNYSPDAVKADSGN